MKKKPRYRYSRQERIDYAVGTIKRYFPRKLLGLIPSIAEWVVDYAATTERRKMRFADIPANIFGLMGTKERDKGAPFPDDITIPIMLLMLIYSDHQVKRGGVFGWDDDQMLEVYQSFAMGLMMEQLKRKGLVTCQVVGGEMFKGFEYELSLLPLYEQMGGMLGLSPQEVATQLNQVLNNPDLADLRKQVEDSVFGESK